MNRTTYTTAIAAACLCMASCAENDLPGNAANGSDKRVVVYTDVEGVVNAESSTRGLIAPADALTSAILFYHADPSDAATSMSGAGWYTASRAAGEQSALTIDAAADGSTLSYNKDNSYMYLVAGYPNSESAAVTNLCTWTIDGKTDLLLSDMWNAGTYTSPKTGTGNGETPLTFKHRLARLEVYCLCVTAENSVATVRETWGLVKSVQLLMTPATATYTYATNQLTFSRAQNKKLYRQDTYLYDFTSASFLPTTMKPELLKPAASGMFAPSTGPFTIRITTEGPDDSTPDDDIVRDITVQLTDKDGRNVDFAAGKRHEVRLIFKADNKAISVSTAITPWDVDGGGTGSAEMVQGPYSVGDYYTDETGKIVGVVFWLDPADAGYKAASGSNPARGKKGLVVGLKETKSMAWSTEFVQLNTVKDDGAKNMALVKQQSGWESKYPAFKVCDDMNQGGQVQWYLPAQNELNYLSCAYNGVAPQTWESVSPITKDLDACTLFRNKFITLGEAVSRYQWCSTEANEGNANSIEMLSSGSFTVRVKTFNETTISARCIRRFP